MVGSIDRVMAVLRHGGLVISALLIMIIALIGAADVVFSFVLHQPIVLTQELSQVLMAIAIFAALAISQHRNEHIAMLLLTQNCGPAWQPMFRAIAVLGQGAFFAFVTWGSWSHAFESVEMRETAVANYGFPIYPAKILFALGSTLMLLETAYQLFCVLRGRPLLEAPTDIAHE
jgi:TRAP-type C4-dicarboxylate transport system permease small subunit